MPTLSNRLIGQMTADLAQRSQLICPDPSHILHHHYLLLWLSNNFDSLLFQLSFYCAYNRTLPTISYTTDHTVHFKSEVLAILNTSLSCALYSYFDIFFFSRLEMPEKIIPQSLDSYIIEQDGNYHNSTGTQFIVCAFSIYQIPVPKASS